MAVHAMRLATASALALALVMARDTQDADAEGCTVIWSNLIYLALNNLLMVYRDIKNGVAMVWQGSLSAGKPLPLQSRHERVR